MKVAQSCPTLTLWTVACQAPLSTEFSRQVFWSGLPFPSPGDLPNPGIEPRSPAWQVDSLLAKPQGNPINPGKNWKTSTMSTFNRNPGFSKIEICMKASESQHDSEELLDQDTRRRQKVQHSELHFPWGCLSIIKR